MIDRTLYTALNNRLFQQKAILLFGTRLVGKSALLKMIIPSVLFPRIFTV